MAAIRRGQEPMRVELPKSSSLTSDLPPLSALFLIYFDIKAGYTIGWKRSLPGIALDGVVEYKSLPSGLHTVKEDLIYFVHDRYAGLSAFANAPASEAARNARMIAVGVLVPLSYGRLGRSWKHADKLMEMAGKLVLDPEDTKVLEDYWESHKAEDDSGSNHANEPADSPLIARFQPIRRQPGWTKKHGRNRSASDGTVLIQAGHTLSSHHPAWNLSALLDLFGPLIFPLHRAALLRRRILISGHAPVHQTCDFVYNISILSNVPLAVTDLLAPSAPPQRLRPLFSIGVHDIPFLEDDLKASTTPAVVEDEEDEDASESGHGWIACTTDGILATKKKLYDVLITLPPSYSTAAKDKVWPKIETAEGVEIKATQRDLRRYRALKWGLSRCAAEPESPSRRRSNTDIAAFGASTPGPPLSPDDHLLDITDTDPIVEPTSWSALAYSGFMWWASAGERRTAHAETEIETDSILLDPFTAPTPTSSDRPETPHTTRTRSQSSLSHFLARPDQTAKREMATIAYFHRLTTRILTTLSDIVDSTSSSSAASSASDDERDDNRRYDDRYGLLAADGDADADDGPAIFVTGADIAKMGLDEWSAADNAFIIEAARAYFARKAEVEGMVVDICGIRIC